MTQTPAHDSIPIDVDVHEVKRLLDSKDDFLLIDCREPSEYEYCRIEGSLLVPMNETPNRMNELEPHRNSRIIVYCHIGGRSLSVVHWLRSQGFKKVQNMAGGIEAWSESIDSAVLRY